MTQSLKNSAFSLSDKGRQSAGWQGVVNLEVSINYRNSQIRKTTGLHLHILPLNVCVCVCNAPNRFYSPNQKPWTKSWHFCFVSFDLFFVGFFCLFGLVFCSLPTVFNLHYDILLDCSDIVSFWGRSKNLNLLFFEQNIYIWNLFRAGTGQWRRILYCNPWIEHELMFLQDIGTLLLNESF